MAAEPQAEAGKGVEPDAALPVGDETADPPTEGRDASPGASMEIHRPKPWHNLRELAKEVGVIAIGIAIALSGEQAIEWLHWRQSLQTAR